MNDAWNRIEQLVDEVAELANTNVGESEFYAELLQRLKTALAADEVLVWRLGERGATREPNIKAEPSITTLQRLGDVCDREELSHPGHVDFLKKCLAEARCVPPMWQAKDGAPSQEVAQNPTRFFLTACPVVVEGKPIRVIEVCQQDASHPETQEATTNVLSAMCEAAADFHRNLLLSELRSREAFWQQCDEFSRRVHKAHNVKSAAYTTANEMRRLLACDRVSVALWQKSRCQVWAVSGAEPVNRRSESVKLLEKLSALAAASNEALLYPNDANPPEAAEWFDRYVDETHVRQVIVAPLVVEQFDHAFSEHQSRCIGALVVERFEAEPDEVRPVGGDGPAVQPTLQQERIASLGRHSAQALDNMLRRQGLANRLSNWFTQKRGAAKAGILLGVLAVLILVLCFVPADFTIEARGQLQPVARQDIFAPMDGRIEKLLVAHDQEVDRGQTLLVISNPELEQEYERLQGEVSTVSQKLLSAQAQRGRRWEENDMVYWAAQQKELQQTLAGLKAQVNLVKHQRERLTLLSPLSGRVQTWDAQASLNMRPVKRGQVLLTVAEVEAEWELELNVPDHHSSHVLQAWEKANGKLQVTFTLKTAPGQNYTGTTRRIANRTTIGEDQRAYVKSTASFDRSQVAELRAGAEVIAKLHCGKRALGYVWLHDLIDAVKTWILF